MTRVAIIGAGLAGRLVALHLLREASASVGIRVIDRGDARYMGPAYSVETDHLLLNVPAWRMGVFPEDEEHFLNWALRRGVRAERQDFLPRRLFREYVLEVLDQARQARTDGPPYEHVRGEATDIDLGRDGATIAIQDAKPFTADRVVLAIGNAPPRDPSIENQAALRSGRYVRNPWTPGVLGAVSRRDTVCFIGTGQTTVDLLVTLHGSGHEGRVVAISRRGVLPLVHRAYEPYPSFFREIEGSRRVAGVFRVIREHLDRAVASGSDARAVIDSLRPDTQALWRGLPIEERKRFLRHLFRHWEIIRSRIPPSSQAVVDSMRASGQLEIVAGRIQDLVEGDSSLEVRYTPRRGTSDVSVKAALVVNCMGPESDYARIDQSLVRNLLRRGLIRPGPANLGLDALPDGAVIGHDGASTGVLYTLGSPMKGVLWEVLAVPEIRVQARELARRLTRRA